MADYIWKPFARENAPTTPVGNNTNVKKARLYQLFESTIDLDELSLPSEEQDETHETQRVESLVSLQHPLIKINDYFISNTEIDFMSIDSTGFLPKITLQCTFGHHTFLSKEMPKDGDIISIAIRNKSNLLKIIRNDYVITAVVSAKNTTETHAPVTLTFYGELFVPWASSSRFNISFEGTSYEAIKDTAKRMGLGFVTNEVDGTLDKQIWISGYNTIQEFVEETSLRSWKDDNSFYDVWIDIYYNLNFINLNDQLMGSEESVDVGAWLNNIDKEWTFGENQDYVAEAPKVLSNYDSYRASPFFIYSWRPINKSTKITYEVGTRINCHLFEHNDKLFYNDSQKYWKVTMEPTYDPGKVDKYILLRGRATQRPELRAQEMAKANYPYTELYVKNPWMGVQYTIGNDQEESSQWDGNHHKNYLRAKLHNTINRKELDKLNVEVSVHGLNLNIVKGDKLPIVLIKKDTAESMMINKESEGNDLLDRFYSGWFMVKGFNIKYSKERKDSIVSNFTQTFILTRREWPPPISVEGIANENIIQT